MRPTPHIDLLRLAGIARVVQGRLRVRNRIYERVFDRAWITRHMPDARLRRQRAAYRRGLLRATAIATAGLVVVSLALAALQQARRADRSARAEARSRALAEQRFYIANMNLAQLDWERNNFQRLRNLLAETRNNPDRDLTGGGRVSWHAPRPGSPEAPRSPWTMDYLCRLLPGRAQADYH